MKIIKHLLIVITLLTFISLPTLNAQKSILDSHFTDYEIVTFDSKKLNRYAQARRYDFIKIPFKLTEEYSWNLELTDQKLFADRFIVREGKQTRSRENANLPIVLKGYSQTSNNIRANITVNDDFLYGNVETLTETIYFEPLSTFDKSASPDQIVVYKKSDVIPNEQGTCAVAQKKRKKEKLSFQIIEKENGNSRSSGPCKEVELAIANEYNVSQARSNVTSWNAGVISDVNTDYDEPGFNNPIQFVIVETFISTGNGSGSGQNEWGSSADANTLLNNFTSWAPSGNGFNNTHDLGGLWTETNLTYNGNPSTIGLAWLGTVCNSYRYHVLEDFTNNAEYLRNLVSHEIGHNFDLNHVSGSVIMAGSVNGSSTWGSTSINEMNSYLSGGSLGCLGACDGGPPGGGNPPVANFDATLLQECDPTLLRFNDLSTNSPTSWSWQFEDGSPSSSTQQNPEIEFPGSGTYRITLTATNADGSDTRILDMNLNSIGNPPIAGYSYSVSAKTVNFTNSSSNATSYSWNFGDGESSVATNPNHVYNDFGTYNVVLTATNDCGTDIESKTVIVADEVVAAFTANTTEICEGTSISFTNQSSANATSFFWEFENGSPSTSTQENPTVIYNNAGSFNVKLTASGGGSSNVENKINYVSINGDPSAAFTHSVNDFSVSFDNNSTGGTEYYWEFGDGGYSVATNPNYVYSSTGIYSVTLTTTNDCGSDVVINEVIIEDEVFASFTVNSNEGCASDSYTFTSTSTGNITAYSWAFENGIPAVSSEENPTISFSSPGLKSIRLTVSNPSSEDTELKFGFINIIEDIVAGFDFSINENTVEFTNTSSESTAFYWDFGDGNTSVATNPTHTYANPGDYNVTLIASNNCDEAESTQIVSIESDIIARFTNSPSEICNGESVQYTSTSEGAISSYFWEFEGGNPSTSTAENPNVTYSAEGIYNVKLTVSDGTVEDSEIKNDFIHVTGVPEAGFTFSQNGYEVGFENTSIGGLDYSWTFGDGESSVLMSPTHTYGAPGNFGVKLVTTNECGSDQSEANVLIEEFVEANFQFSNDDLCSGGSISFENTSEGDINSFYWEFEGGTPATSNDENPSVTYTGSGEFDVKLTVTGVFGAMDSKSLTNVITVNAGPTADFSFVLSDKTLEFTNLSSNFDVVSWNFGDGSTSTAENPSHTYENEGVYIVVLEVEGFCGIDSKEIEISVFDQLLANFQASQTSLCPGEEVVLEDLSSGNPTEWEWTILGEEMISTEEQNPIISLDVPGTYTVELIVRNEEEEDSKTVQQYIEVIPLPDVDFTYEQNELTVDFSNNSENGNEFYWDFGDGNTSIESNPNHIYSEEGLYAVMLRVENSCSTEEFEQEIPVFNKLVIGFASEERDICETNSIQFNDQSSGNATSWEWTFPGGSPSSSTEKNPVVTYEQAGEYDVTLKVNSETEELVETKNGYVKVGKLPVAFFEFAVDKNKVEFYNLSENADSYHWSFGSEEVNPIFEFDEEKAYEVRLVTTNGCASDTVTQTIDLYEEAMTYGNFSLAGDAYCMGDPISFIDLSSEDITEWNWKFPGATPSESSEKNPSVIYESYGVYDVELTVSNGFNTRTVSMTDYVKIMESPTAGFTIQKTNNFVAINNTALHAEETTWFLEGKKITGELKHYTFAKNGVFTIRQVVKNTCGSSETTQSVEVTAYPSAGFSVDITQGCAPLTVTFESRSTDNADEVTWILEGTGEPEVSGFSPTVTYETAGNYGIKVIATNNFGSDTIELNSLIEVLAQPEVSFEYEVNGLEVNFLASSEAFDSIIWDLGDGNTWTGSTFVHEYDVPGEYIVKVTAFVGECSGTFENEVTLLSSNVGEIDNDVSVVVYPNPARRAVQVDFKEVEGVYGVELVDQVGRRIMNREIKDGATECRLNGLRGIPSGQYYILLKIEDRKSIYKKLMIVR